MMKAGVIGLGDMGSGLAKNLIKHGFETYGFDLDETKRITLRDGGGIDTSSAGDVGKHAEAVFVMVMNGDQAKAVIFGDDGLVSTMAKGGIILLTATIKPSEAKDIGAMLEGTGLSLIDSPVSGGYPGAHGGTLTMMASAPDEVLAKAKPVIEAVSGTCHHVGTSAGEGQIMKACLQSLIGSIFSATYEATTMAAKAGVSGQKLFDVFSTSAAGCGIVNSSIANIMERKFEGTGSGIGTMHKDLTISLNMAEELGISLFTAATAMQIFHQGKSKYPDGDNQSCALVMEEIAGAKLHR